jgi:hypothetical protein
LVLPPQQDEVYFNTRYSWENISTLLEEGTLLSTLYAVISQDTYFAFRAVILEEHAR